MKTTIFLIAMLLSGGAMAQKQAYDSVLAKKYGADDYGMKQYVMVFLVTGKAEVKEKAKRDSLFAGHMANIGRLAKEGKLAMAGPFGKNDINYRGVFIFNTASVDDAKAMVSTDPAVAAGIFDAVYIPWYGSAALMEVNELHEKIQKVSF
ncbi:MAG: YciI family protein [Ferruginibacter sp.]